MKRITDKQGHAIWDWYADQVAKGHNQLRDFCNLSPEAGARARERFVPIASGMIQQMHRLHHRKTKDWLDGQHAEIREIAANALARRDVPASSATPANPPTETLLL